MANTTPATKACLPIWRIDDNAAAEEEGGEVLTIRFIREASCANRCLTVGLCCELARDLHCSGIVTFRSTVREEIAVTEHGIRSCCAKKADPQTLSTVLYHAVVLYLSVQRTQSLH